jgi:hypothetical protein
VNGESDGPALGGRAESSFGSGPASPVSDVVSTPRAATLGVGNAVLGSVLVNGSMTACFSLSWPLIFLYCYSSALLLLRSMARGLHMPVCAAWVR